MESYSYWGNQIRVCIYTHTYMLMYKSVAKKNQKTKIELNKIKTKVQEKYEVP